MPSSTSSLELGLPPLTGRTPELRAAELVLELEDQLTDQSDMMRTPASPKCAGTPFSQVSSGFNDTHGQDPCSDIDDRKYPELQSAFSAAPYYDSSVLQGSGSSTIQICQDLGLNCQRRSISEPPDWAPLPEVMADGSPHPPITFHRNGTLIGRPTARRLHAKRLGPTRISRKTLALDPYPRPSIEHRSIVSRATGEPRRAVRRGPVECHNSPTPSDLESMLAPMPVLFEQDKLPKCPDIRPKGACQSKDPPQIDAELDPNFLVAIPSRSAASSPGVEHVTLSLSPQQFKALVMDAVAEVLGKEKQWRK